MAKNNAKLIAYTIGTALIFCHVAAAEMLLQSDTIVDGGTLPMDHVANQFGCEGGNLSPSLRWTGAPEGTESFVLLVFDPDAPTDSGWWHWGAYNIGKTEDQIFRGAGSASPARAIDMIQVRNDFSIPNYTGACPPEGADPHRYQFSVFAMPMATLPVEEPVSPALLSFFARNYALGSATITATFAR